MRAARRSLRAVGVEEDLRRGSKLGAAYWFRSLLAIYDAEDLVSLDVPWWSVGAAERVERFLAARKGTARVFEWGSGASTVWLARRAAGVTSIEHDMEWARKMRRLVQGLPHVDLRYVAPVQVPEGPAQRSGRRGLERLDFASYVNAIRDCDGRFDLIVVDGRCRSQCLEEALQRLAPDGLIVLDDSHRLRYRQAFARPELLRTAIRGRAYCLPYPSETSLIRLMRSAQVAQARGAAA